MSAKTKTLRVLELHRDQWLENQLLQLDTNWVLRFTVAPGIYAENVRVFTDFPDEGELYVRGKLRELPWKFKGKEPRWDPDRHIDLDLISAGAYRFVVTLGNVPSGAGFNRAELTSCGYFLVNPDLGYSPESIACQTIVTKLLGPLSEWRSRLAVSYHSGYNMVHFTPIQKLGSSKSAYSIANQLKLDPAYLPSKYMYHEVDATFINRCGVLGKLKVDSALVEVEQLISHMRKNWGMLSIVDLVWNHTSFDTPWLIEHPEAGYNLVNSPHLRPAYAMDVALYEFSQELVAGTWASMGLQPYVQSEHDIQLIHMRLLDTVLPQAKLWEYFCVDVDAIVEEFRNTVYRMNGGEHPKPEGKSLSIIQDPQYRRLGSSVDADLTLELFNVHMPGTVCFEERIESCCASLRRELYHLNNTIQQSVQDLIHSAVNNLAADIRYQFLEAHGPKRKEVTPTNPLTRRYFHVVGGGPDLSWSEMEGSKGKNVLAFNGWVMDADPLVNFAEEGSQVYLKRELIVWGDSVKLRYGSGPSDSPWLWAHMIYYTQTMAWLFAGFRLDNCHNTPIHVAEALLDAAREVRPNLYVLAELFTSSEEKDNYFVNRLGINTLIREAMSAGIPRELGRLVYKYGGTPVASFFSSDVLKPSVSHAMFVDATHDNDPGHILSRCVQDVLPNTALVTIASCASCSCRGYDELVPHQIHVVDEDRLYAMWNDAAPPNSLGEVGSKTGIIAAKLLLNRLHAQLALEGFTQIYVDQVTEEIVAVTRHCPASHRSYILMAHTAFHPPPDWATPTEDRPNTGYNHVPPLSVPGKIKEIVLEARLVKKKENKEFHKNSLAINGLESHLLEINSHIPLSKSCMCHLMGDNSSQEVVFNDFAPGSIIVFEVDLLPEASHAVQVIRSFLGCESTTTDGKALWNKLTSFITSLSLADINHSLYRCDNEEHDGSGGGGVYVVPGAGAMVYCGLQGTISMLQPVRDNNDLGHPLCDNLRAGDWLAGYTVNRLKRHSGTKKMADILGVVLEQHLSNLPRYLVPCYFDAIVTRVYNQLKETAIGSMNRFVQDGSSLVKALAMGSIQLHGETCSASLPSALPGEQPQGCLAAGLPHFSTGYMRCWGRDTFIALRGLLMTTGRFKDAESAILGFAACLRHGLIPNLLSGGLNPRYNCRDATWWWLQSIQDYCLMAPAGNSILLSPVRKLFADDDASVDFDSPRQVSLVEIIQEALECHTRGISFRERGAGPGLDRDMTMPGFNVTAGVFQETGFVFGGNSSNCGTWMDKVGESAWAGNKGVPATPRDGSAIELVSLCFSAVNWLAGLHKNGLYPHKGVPLTEKKGPGAPWLTYAEWAQKLKDNFEQHFWIPKDKADAANKEGGSAGYIHRTGMYKDTVGSTHKYTDYQLRPNFPIAIVVAPELFTPDYAWSALQLAQETLVGPLGMKTLDPHDWQYNGFYINSVDSGDYKTARGMNYHQGPEWLWVTGYFLRACLFLAKKLNRLDETVTAIHQSLSAHAQALRDSPWQGLPELTNEGGAECTDSCPVQAWTMACLLDVLYDLSLL